MALQKYLSRYAEPEASCFNGFDKSYQHVLCIPVFAEPAHFLNDLLAKIADQSLLIILVANANSKASGPQITQTREFANGLIEQYHCENQYADNIHLLTLNSTIDLLLIERCRADFFLPEKEGVGLARKIACDIACQLILLEKIQSSWIHTTDADAILPTDYLQASETLDDKKDSAGIYPFHHSPHPDKQIRQAQALYDFSMDYYVAGLEWAGSTLAWHTIGSTLLINAEHYAQARGFPKRQAGEDFYLLSKLAKTGCIQKLKTTAITLGSRLSNRVPFGTGPALIKIMAMEKPHHDYLYYHPRCFLALKCWLSLCSQLRPEKVISLTPIMIENFIADHEEFSEIDSGALHLCLQALGSEPALEHAFIHSKSKAVLDRHLLNWFDSFRTLKFIHWMRDNQFPSIPLKDVQEEVSFPFTRSTAINFAENFSEKETGTSS